MPAIKIARKILTLVANVIFSIFYRVNIINPHNVSIESMYGIIIANHASFLDSVVISLYWPRLVYWLCTDYLFSIPVLKQLLGIFCVIPINHKLGKDALLKAMMLAKQNRKMIGIFPEGTRSCDGSLLLFKNGASFIAVNTKLPIIPIYLSGTYKAWSRHRLLPKPFCTFNIYIGQPISAENIPHTSNKELYEIVTRMSRESIANLEQLSIRSDNNETK